MKWCFLINNFNVLPEFFSKVAKEALTRGDQCVVIFGSKIAEFEKKKFFPAGTEFISMPDWCINNPANEKEDFNGISWKDFFPLFERNPLINFDYQKSIVLAQQTVRFYQYIFEKEKPDIIVNEPPSGFAHLVAWHFAQKHNVQYLCFADPRLDTTIIDVYDHKFTSLKYQQTFETLSDGDVTEKERNYAEEFVKKFISHDVATSAIGSSKIHFNQARLVAHFFKRLGQVYGSLWQYLLVRKKYRTFDIESEIRVKTFFRAFFAAQIRKFRIFAHQQFFAPLPKHPAPYFLFPLHYQPEAATDVFAIYYCDQLAAARNMAFSLPFPYKLYVKEHPAGVGTRHQSFYQELKKIPNIVLVSPDENVEQLIKNSAGIIALTSTLGLEAAMAGKPVYVLGEVFYSYHPLCRQVDGFEQLKQSIEKDIAMPQSIIGLQQINARFLAAYMRHTILGNMVSATTSQDSNDYAAIYESLVNNFVKPYAK